MTPDEIRKERYKRIQRRRRAGIEAGTWRYRVPADVVVEHVRQLRAAGMSVGAIAAAAGLPDSTLAPIAWPNHSEAVQYVMPPTADALLAVRGPEQAPEWALVPNVATRRRIEALQAMGWSLGYIAERLGVSRQAISQTKRRPRVQVAHARRLAALYDELSMRVGPDDRTRTWADKNGYVPPLAWDDDSIDDPKARPNLGRREDAMSVDTAVVERVLLGQSQETNQAEREVIVPRLNARGLSDSEIADLCRVWPETILRIRRRHGVGGRYAA